ncbi:NADH dehydrogenase subunit K [Paludibacter propionicigenes WB4]|jgi:NADH:ubiquinone oxidoreductase subunit K|uniref:NADH-quinone oxidoreductase subunit K n=1 Tax=Paludibacter propionicigenes (strain DSM 17365 / JCM 13257 / WB4) TaxID=694427 RepID=E4T1C6_PALPW|nr:NADH-quinone oxidoreductase subunit NuoK [Paludibacter propionicigenes]ADQ78520.1 NADH dehydrogenase subunit K [Paludibacter propionicigenes WB4]
MGDLLTNLFTGSVPMEAYLAVSLIMFFSGVYGFLTRRSLLMILISIELMLNAADINFVVFNRYLYPGQLEGFYFTLFTIAIAACETAVAIAIIINIYRNLTSVEVGTLDQMKE